MLWTIRALHEQRFWLEIVTLVIPGFNDSDEELHDIARFLVSISPDIPWHVTAFHQDYKMTDPDNTDARTLLRAAEIGVAEGLRFVYAGNLPGPPRPLGEHVLSGLPRASRRAHRLPRPPEPHPRRPLPRLPARNPRRLELSGTRDETVSASRNEPGLRAGPLPAPA